MSSWETYLDEKRALEILDKFNSKVGESRQVSLDTAKSLLASAVEKYDYIETEEEVANALEWDLYGFTEYATQGINASGEFYSQYADLLPEGHPHFSGYDTEESVNWLLGDKNIDTSHAEVITASLSENSDQYKKLHATVRLQALLAAGNLKPTTSSFVSEILNKLD